MIRFIKNSIVRLRLIFFYIFNPKFLTGFFPILFDYIIRGSQKKYFRNLSYSICKANSISINEAFKIITGEEDYEFFSEIFKEEIFEAKKRVLDKGDNKGFNLDSAADLDLLYAIIKKLRIKNVLETGVASGWSSLAMLLAQEKIKGSKLISIDMPFYNYKNPRNLVGLAVPERLKRNWILLREADRIGIPKAFRYNYDFGLVHYDSDKTYYGRKWAIEFIWERLKKDSLLIIDDIGDNMHYHDFIKLKRKKPIILMSNKKYVGIIKK